MSSINVCTLSGRLGKDAELRYTASGKAITNFSIAVDIGWGENKKTMWVSCGIWGERGEKVAEYFTKGLSVVVTGEIELRDWRNKDGDSKQSLSMTVRDWDFMSKAGDQGGYQQAQQGQGGFRSSDSPRKEKPTQQREAFVDDDIPF